MVRDYVDTDDNIGVHESIRTESSQESEGEKLDDFTNTSDGGKRNLWVPSRKEMVPWSVSTY